MEEKQSKTKKEMNRPLVETTISLSEDKNWVIHTTRIVDIKPVNYLKKVIESSL